jgi:hypothetical protein
MSHQMPAPVRDALSQPLASTPRIRRLALAWAVAAACALMTCAQGASAANCVWNTSTGNWSTAGDWSCGAVPGSTDSATISGTQTVIINSAQSTLNLTNAGVVDLNAFTLTLVGGGSTINTGTINVGAGPIPNNAALQVSAGHNINNTSGVINISADSVLNQFGSTISGGTINTSGTGAVVVFGGSNFLSGVTLNGTLDMATNANSRERIINGATINGVVNIANGGILSLDSANTSGGNQTLAGTVSINLNDVSARLSIEGNGSTTLGSGVTVRGQGNIGTPAFVGGTNILTNNGLISADVSGGTLTIVPPGNSGSLVNNGTLQAVGGGTLVLETNTDNTNGQISAKTGSTVVQSGVTITGGAIGTSGTGAFQASSSGSNVLNGVNFNGTLDLTSIANAREQIINGATINGAVNIANGGILTLNSASTAGGNQTLAGTVSINLNDANARLSIDGTGSTTLGSGVTVHGQGNIGTPAFVGGINTLTNNGLISADVGGGTLSITAPGNSGSFINNTTLQAVNGATLLLSTSINNAGQILASSGSTVTQNGVAITGGTVTTSGTGTLQVTSSGSNVLNGVNFSGTLDLTSIANAREQIINAAPINGVINVANGGILTLNSESTTGGNQTLAGTVSINLNDANARLSIDGTGSTTLGSGVTVHGQGNIGTPAFVGGTNTLTNNGLISADVAGGTLSITTPGNSGSFINNTTVQAVNGATLLLSTNVSNAGQILAGTGSTVTQNGVAITGGTVATSGTGALQVTSSGSNVLNGVNFSGTLDLSTLANTREQIINGATINGAVNIANGGILSLNSAATTAPTAGVQTIGGTGVINLNDASARLSIEGNGSTTLAAGLTVRGQGNIGTAVFIGGTNTLFNNGTIIADGGTLTIAAPANNGTLSGGGTLQTSGGTLNLNTASASTQGHLVMGGAGSALNLNAQNLTITGDYTNAQFGSGNSFNARAGVSGTGQVLAGGDATQVISGAGVTNGSTANATLSIGNVHVGANTFDYQIGNGGTTGPTLRGAVQTSANGASITDSRLLGGVTAGNYNAGAPGGGGSAQTVTYTATSAGVQAPLSGQVLNLASNFANIGNLGNQKLDIVLGGGAAAYNLAAGSTANVAVSNQRVGGTTVGALTVSNTAPSGSFTEALNAAFAGSTGSVTGTSGSITGGTGSGVAGGASNSTAMTVGIDTSTAGAKSGTATLNYVSNGTGSSGLGNTAVGSQTVNVTGNVYQVAAGVLNTAPLNFGTVQVGQSVSQVLSISNVATGAAGFVEDLNARFGSSSGTGASAISGTGSIAGLVAGGANATGMTVSVNTAAAGTIAGAIGVNFYTAGTVAGISNGLGESQVGSASYGVSGTIQTQGQVINQASPLINTPTVALGNVRVGAVSPTQFVSVSNVATTAPQAALDASISTTAPLTASGSFTLLNPGATNNTSLRVGMNTATAGSRNGTATLTLVSDASNVGGCGANCQLALASQTVNVTGAVYQVAQASLPTAVNVGNFRVGSGPVSQTITIGNTNIAPGFQEGLNVTAGGTSGGATISGGPITNLAAGSTSSAISVGLTGTQAGLNTGGTATMALGSNGSTTSGLSTLSLGNATINVTGTGYRVADPTVNISNVTLVARVGDTAPTATVSITNASPDQYTEGLKVSGFTTAAPGFTASGSIANLAAQASNSTALKAALNTGAAGTFSGQGTLTLVSTGAGTDNAADLALAAQTVNLSGKVYTVAQAQVAPTPVNFGYVHVGDTITTQNVTVTNTAAVTALNDVLNGTLSGVTGPFSASGGVNGVTAGSSTSLGFGLSTAAAGTFNSAATLALASHDADQADLSLGSTPIALSATVNYHAAPEFELGSGAMGTLTNTGTDYVLDLGEITQGTEIDEMLALLNGAAGQSDLLEGGFTSSGTGLPVTFGGFGDFTGLSNGQSVAGDALINTAVTGSIDELLTFAGTGYNPNFQEGLGATLLIEGTVLSGGGGGGNLPEPGSLPLTVIAGGLLAASVMVRRRRPESASLRA